MSQPETLFNTCYGDLTLFRYPEDSNHGLRAWDAADEYLIDQFNSDSQSVPGRPLLVNDAFGALTCALHPFAPINWSDSWMAHKAAELNLDRNELTASGVTFVASTSVPKTEFATVLMKAPKNLSLLEYQLAQLTPKLAQGARLWVAGMQRYMPSRLWQLLEHGIGPCETLPGVRKAKLIKVTKNHGQQDGNAVPRPLRWQLEDQGLTIGNQANVFSREKLDIGTRFLLDHLPSSKGSIRIADLGCGNGVLGLVAGKQNRDAQVMFLDESWLAIKSAQENAKQIDGAEQRFSFHCTDGLVMVERNSLHRILCNPPFHQQHQVGDYLALRMFEQASECLRNDGDLWVVANHHLGYRRSLKRWFRSVKLIASNRKFVILKATDPSGKI